MSADLERLDQLTGKIRQDIEAADKHWQNAVHHAIRAGEGLIEAKNLVSHGEWLPWLRANFPGFSERSAQNYMRLAQNRNAVADLPTLRDAIALLARPKAEITVLPRKPRETTVPTSTIISQSKRQPTDRTTVQVRVTHPEPEVETIRRPEVRHTDLVQSIEDRRSAAQLSAAQPKVIVYHLSRATSELERLIDENAVTPESLQEIMAAFSAFSKAVDRAWESAKDRGRTGPAVGQPRSGIGAGRGRSDRLTKD